MKVANPIFKCQQVMTGVSLNKALNPKLLPEHRRMWEYFLSVKSIVTYNKLTFSYHYVKAEC